MRRPAQRVAASAPPRDIRFPRWVLAMVTVTVCVAAPIGVAAAGVRAATAGGIGLRLMDSPGSAGDDPRARLYIVDHLAPGTTIHRRIEASNSTASPQRVVLYPTGATVANGTFLGADGHASNELSSWTSVDPAAAHVRSGGRLTATVTIRVPSDASPGERYGVVWAEIRSTPDVDGEVTQVNRVGIRIYLSIGPGGAPAADFTIDSLVAERSPEGEPTILATVRNTGGRALDMNGTLELTGGPGGLSAGPFLATLGTTLAIGDTEPVAIALDAALPNGPWDAWITLRSGLLVREARATITFPVVGVAPPVRTAPVRPGWLYPAVAGVAILVLLGVAGSLARARRARASADRHPAGSARQPSPSVGSRRPARLVR